MGIILSLILIAVGAILTWAGFWGYGPEPYTDGPVVRRRAYRPSRRRTTYVEEDAPPPGPPA